jgi:hypothetical protein
VRAILIHGMGRTPASMLILALRFRASGIRRRAFLLIQQPLNAGRLVLSAGKIY